LKAAYVEESIYVGADQLPMLVEIKSKDELLGEIIGLLQSPATNVISALKAQGGNIAGILQTLAEKGE
jgi:large subunit ribosomal protein L10